MLPKNPLLQSATLLFFVLFFGLAGCAGRITKADCEKANFYEMGLDDGQDGETVERLTRYKNACSAEGVAVLEERYNYGYQVGLAEYCDESRGRSDSKKMVRTAVCVEGKVPPYITAYNAELAKNKNKVAEELAKIQKSKDELQKAYDELKAKQAEIDGQGAIL
jgi:hypothetical protein